MASSSLKSVSATPFRMVTQPSYFVAGSIVIPPLPANLSVGRSPEELELPAVVAAAAVVVSVLFAVVVLPLSPPFPPQAARIPPDISAIDANAIPFFNLLLNLITVSFSKSRLFDHCLSFIF